MATFHILKAGSSVNWTGKKVLGLHTGTIDIAGGQLDMENGQPVSGEITIDMRSIRITDIVDPATNKQFLDHLWHEDFFAVEQHPVATLKVHRAAKEEGNLFRLFGDLIIKDITHPISFVAGMDVLTSYLHASGEMVIDRTQYNIRYGSGKFIPNLGDKLIYDDFTLQFKLVGALPE